MKLPLLILAGTLALAAPSSLAQTTQKLSASKANEYGLIYMLPRTAFDITFETEYVERTPGEFYNYAKLKLGDANAITKPSRTVNIKSVVITPRGISNEDSRWLVQFKAGSTPYILLDDNGCLLSVNTEDVVEVNAPTLPVPQAAAPTALETAAASQAITQDMTLSSSLSKKADLVAQRIFELRENRSDLISGQAENIPSDGKAMQLALDNLAAQEAALTAMFIGTEKRWTDVTTLSFEPDSEAISNEIFARLSPIDGIVDANDLSGSPIYISFDILESGSLPINEKGEVKAFPRGGLAYNIPGSGQITLNYGGRKIASQQFNIAQLGVTFGLDPKLFSDKKAPSKLLLDPTTGGIAILEPVDN